MKDSNTKLCNVCGQSKNHNQFPRNLASGTHSRKKAYTDTCYVCEGKMWNPIISGNLNQCGHSET